MRTRAKNAKKRRPPAYRKPPVVRSRFAEGQAAALAQSPILAARMAANPARYAEDVDLEDDEPVPEPAEPALPEPRTTPAKMRDDWSLVQPHTEEDSIGYSSDSTALFADMGPPLTQPRPSQAPRSQSPVQRWLAAESDIVDEFATFIDPIDPIEPIEPIEPIDLVPIEPIEKEPLIDIFEGLDRVRPTQLGLIDQSLGTKDILDGPLLSLPSVEYEDVPIEQLEHEAEVGLAFEALHMDDVDPVSEFEVQGHQLQHYHDYGLQHPSYRGFLKNFASAVRYEKCVEEQLLYHELQEECTEETLLDHIISFFDELYDAGYAPTTLRSRYSAIKKWWLHPGRGMLSVMCPLVESNLAKWDKTHIIKQARVFTKEQLGKYHLILTHTQT
jgi:hypothetical protein